MNITFDEISKWAADLTKRLIEIRFWDIEEIEAALKVHLAMGMKECLSIQVPETKRKITETKFLISTQPENQWRLQGELAKLNEKYQEEISVARQVESIVRKDEKFKVLSRLIGQRFGDDVLDELKIAVKLELKSISDGTYKEPENAYQRGVRETKEKLIDEFERMGLHEAVNFLKN